MSDTLTNALPVRLRPYAKAVYPFVATILAVIVTAIITKQPADTETLKVAVTGLVTTLLAFYTPNRPTEPVDTPPAPPTA